MNIPNELMRHINGGVKVAMAWGVEREVRVRATAITPAIALHCAQLPECPARNGWSAWDVARVGLEEVDLVQRVGVGSTTQQCEENK